MTPVSRQPVIALCASAERARWSFWDTEAVVVSTTYVRAVSQAGGLSMIVPPSTHTAEAVDVILDAVDAVMIIGGADLDPSTYGAAREPRAEMSYPLRDACELAITRRALVRDIPILGICRGMQLLNVALGGTLIQHLADADMLHRRALGTFEGTEHIALLAAGSRVQRAVGEHQHLVHCHHHQAVDVLGRGLVVAATAAGDGVIEAIESRHHAYVVGVQWHPEANERSRIITDLVEAARHTRKPRPLPVH